MSGFDVINDSEGKEYLVFDSSELYEDSQMGNCSDDFEILRKLGEGAFGRVFKVRSKKNNKVYAMKQLNIKDIRQDNEKAYQLTINETSFLEGLNNPHIIKYYKNFTEGDFLYIIIEFIANGDMNGFIEAHQKFNKHIQEEQLWNIFLQCMEALTYVHSMGVIHRDIKPANLLMDNNMSIKLGDFGVSAFKNKDGDNQYLNAAYNPFKNKEHMKYHGTTVGTTPYMAKELIQQNEYDQKVDVYAMGVSFFEMCYFFNPRLSKNKQINVQYSNELRSIINMMMEEDKNKRKTSEEIFNLIKTEYSNKYAKNTSIDAIIRCLSCFNDFNSNFTQIEQIQDKPITSAYIQCLQTISDPEITAWSNSINNFRQILASQNPKLEGTKEIDPRTVFAFLIGQLHKELNKHESEQDKSNKYLIISGEEDAKTSKIEMMLKFINEMNLKFNSLISNNFMGYMKLTNFCSDCQLKTYSFNSFFFITFNLEKILKTNNINIFNIEDNFQAQNQNQNIQSLYCSKCLNKTNHSCYKQFYSFPDILVISIQRGITYNCKTPVNVKVMLDLTDYAESFCKKKFNLIGLIGRSFNNGNEAFFSVVKFGDSWFNCEGTNINEVNNPSDSNSRGDILMLFYEGF